MQTDDALRSRLPSSDVETEREDEADALPRLRPEARMLLGTQKRRRTKKSPAKPPRDVRLARDFDLVEKLGAGTFSDVWRCRCKADGTEYAVKVAKRPFRSRRARDAALVEARALRALEGVDRVIAFHCAWQEGGHLHSQLELCALGSLRQLVDALDDSVAGLEEDPYLSRLLGDAGDALAHVRAGNNNGPVQTSPSRSRRRRFGRFSDGSRSLGAFFSEPMSNSCDIICVFP